MARMSAPRRAKAITIRAATPDDLTAIVKHRRNMFRDDLGSSAAALTAMERTSAPFIERGLREGWYHGWLAMASGRAVAGAGVIVYDWPSNPRAPEQTQRAYLLNVYTEPAFRGRGLARPPAIAQFAIRAELRRPVARHAPADGENAQPLLLQQSVGKMIEIEKGIVGEGLHALVNTHAIVQGHVETEFGISECRDKNGDAFSVGRFQNAAAGRVLGQVLADGAV